MAIDPAQLEKAGVYDARVPLRTLLEDLTQIGNLVAAAEARRKRIRNFAGLSLIAAIVLGIAARFVGPPLGILALLGVVAWLVLFIYSFITGRNLHKHHDRFDLLNEMCRNLQSDADPNAKFAVKLLLKAAPSLVREEKFPQRKNGKQKFFEEDFLVIGGSLLDGTYLEQTVTELKRERSYTNPRGKSKSKTRLRYQLDIRLGYPADVYGNVRLAQHSLNQKIRVPPSAKVKDIGVKEKSIAIKTVVGSEKEVPQTSAMVCLGAYRILNFARRGAGK